MPDLGDALWETEPSAAGFSMVDVHRRADRLRNRRRRVQGFVSAVVVVVVGTGLIVALRPDGAGVLLGPAPVPSASEAPPPLEAGIDLDAVDEACEQVDAATRRGTVDVPFGVGIQEAIETGLTDGWELAGPVWQLPVDDPSAETPTWWTAAPVTGPGTAAVAVWVSPDRDATRAAGAAAPTERAWERPEEVYLYAADDLARQASVWTNADNTPYAAFGRSVQADLRVAVCAASTNQWPTGPGEPGPPPAVEPPSEPSPSRDDSGCTPGHRTYVVQEGDTLSSIAEAVYGDPVLFGPIAEANGLTGSGAFFVGQVLRIPDCEISHEVEEVPWVVAATVDADVQQAIENAAPQGWQPRPTDLIDGLVYDEAAGGGVVIRQLSLDAGWTPEAVIEDAMARGAGGFELPDGAHAAFTNPVATGYMLVPLPGGRLIQIAGEGDIPGPDDYEIGTYQQWMDAVRTALN